MTIIPRPEPVVNHTKRCPLCNEKFESISELSLAVKFNKHVTACRKKEFEEFNKEYYLE